MASGVLVTAFVWTVLGYLTVQSQVSPKPSSCTREQSCGSCFTSGPDCAWCKQEAFDEPPANQDRCNSYENLKIYGCRKKNIVYPTHRVKSVTEELLRNAEQGIDAIQLSPQNMTIKVRPHSSFKFNLTFREAENYPVDLYYLMDLSYSMRDDKAKIAALGNLLAESMSRITKNFRLGFGSFVDKKVMPYVSTVPEKLLQPCPNCAPPYGFKNQLSLTEDTHQFAAKVAAAPVSGNLDGPEGGFDAIMQAVVCGNEIGWRKKSRKMLVFSTDAQFHYAGDGKLGGIVIPNDGTCHLDRDGMYTESTNQDYPSISQLANVIGDNKVNVIFAVTKTNVPVYRQLSSFIDGSIAGELANDSSNVVKLVEDNYNEITSKVKFVTEGAEGISVKFRSKCFGDTVKETNQCDGVGIGAEVSFEVSVEVQDCPKDAGKRRRQLSIYPVGLTERLTINLESICECNCEKPEQEVPDSPRCSSGNGTFECGKCTCNDGRYGKYCECDGSELNTKDYEASCRIDNSSAVCSDQGQCVCGQCECFERGRRLGQRYAGSFCECDPYSCSFAPDNQEMCGGPGRGQCTCGNCTCREGWEGLSCECPIGQSKCIASNGLMCNGKGTCTCGRCVCNLNSYYSGPTCEDCPTCPGLCADNKECVQCHAFHTGPIDTDDCIANCTNIEMDDAPSSSESARVCQFTDDDGCIFYFSYEYDQFGNTKIIAQRTKACPTPVNIAAIVLAVIGSIVLIGLIVLLIWKLYTSIHDRREFAKWEKESKNAKWDTSENPIYKQATSSFNNPTYAGKK